MSQKPTDVLDKAIMYGMFSSLRHGPGGIIKKLSDADRETLSELTSDDLAKMRVPEHVCRAGERKGRAR